MVFNNLSSSNLTLINGRWLNAKMENAFQILGDGAAFLYHPKILFIHFDVFYGIPYNAFESFEADEIRMISRSRAPEVNQIIIDFLAEK